MTMDPSLPVKDLLALVDKTFGIERILLDKGRDIIAKYYAQSGPAYEKIHSKQGCMHLALNSDGVFSAQGYRTQPKAILQELKEMKATRALELGCGKGFNTLFVAQRFARGHCTATDLIEAHVAKARELAAEAGQANVTYEQASFEPLPDRYVGFDLVFAFETLCYAQDTDLVAQSIAASLRPGGRFVMYDVHAWENADELPKEMALITRLYEISMAVTHGFIRTGKWEASLERAGLVVDQTQDLAHDVQPGLKHLHDMGVKTLSDWKTRLAIKVMPPYMSRNAIAALFGPYVYRLAGQESRGVLTYQKITATKPK